MTPLHELRTKIDRRRPYPTRPAALKYARVSYSQFGEDLFLASLLPDAPARAGCYVDVGCYRPVQDSNTYRLYQLGWSGLAIDASPRWRGEWASIRPRDRFVQQAIAGTRREMKYCADRLYPTCSHLVDVDAGGTLPANADGRYEISTVEAAPLGDVLREHGVAARFDLLNVDCEGFDLQVVRTLDFEAHRPRIVVIEDHDTVCDSATTRHFVGQRYVLRAMIGYTKIFTTE